MSTRAWRFERHTCTHARARTRRSDRDFRATHKQKEQRNRKEKGRLHPVETQRKTQNPRMVLQVLKHRGAPLEDQEKPACAMG